jgi:hypothetical protein
MMKKRKKKQRAEERVLWGGGGITMLASKHLDFVLLAGGRATLGTGKSNECDEHCDEQSGLHLPSQNLSQIKKKLIRSPHSLRKGHFCLLVGHKGCYVPYIF